MTLEIGSKIRHLTSIAFLLIILTFSTSLTAHAGVESLLKNLLKSSTKADPNLKVHQLTKFIDEGHSKASIVYLDGNGQINVGTWTRGVSVKNEIFREHDLVFQRFKNVSGEIGIDESFLKKYESTLLKLSSNQNIKLRLLTANDSKAYLAVRRVGLRDTLVITQDRGLSFSLNAWKQQKILRQDIMYELYSRKRVIVVAPRSDLILRQAYKKALGKAVKFVDSESALRKELKHAKKRLVVLVGHVEKDEFVLRQANGEATFSTKIEDVHGIIDKSKSMGLMMGCEISCASMYSGPQKLIDAMKVVEGISTGNLNSSPMKYLEDLAAKTGEFHIDEDLFGRLRVVKMKSVSDDYRNAVLLRGGSITISNNLSAPIRLSDMLKLVVFVILYALFIILYFWFIGIVFTMIFGISPQKSKNIVRENYSEYFSEPEIYIDNYSTLKKIVFFTLGRYQIILTIILVLYMIGPFVIVSIFTLATIPISHFVCSGSHKYLKACDIYSTEGETRKNHLLKYYFLRSTIITTFCLLFLIVFGLIFWSIDKYIPVSEPLSLHYWALMAFGCFSGYFIALALLYHKPKLVFLVIDIALITIKITFIPMYIFRLFDLMLTYFRNRNARAITTT